MAATTTPPVTTPEAADAPPLSRSTVLLLSVAVGTVVANLFYAQPLEDTLSQSFGVSTRSMGLAITLVQVGYAVGLATLVPLGDLVERRRLLVPMLGCTVAGLLAMALAPNFAVFLVAAVAVGLTCVAAQVIVPFAAHLAPPDERGRVVSTVMSGLLLGVLLSRVAAGVVGHAAGWRWVFAGGAAATATIAVVLWRRLPRLEPLVRMPYPALLGSVVRLVRDEPVLRRRMLYGGLCFASFSAFWTSAGFMLADEPYGWSEAAIGAVALVGAAGALAARFAGRLADRGHVHGGTGGFLIAMTLSYGLLAVADRSLVALLVGVAVMDLGCQGVHISNQSVVYALAPEARSRINTAYMTSYFVAGSAGSALSAVAYSSWGWAGVSVVGAVCPTLATLAWGLESLGRRASRSAVAAA